MTRHLGKHCTVGVASALALSLGPACCFASSVLETIGAPGTGNGFSARVMSRGTEVTYFNPSRLAETTSDLSFGFLVLGHWGRVRLSPKSAATSVPSSIYDADLVQSSASGQRFWPQPTEQLLHPRADTEIAEVTPYVALGMVRPLLRDFLVFGAYAVVPTQGFLHQDSFFSDEREQYFSNQLHPELLGDRLKVPSLAAAVGGRLSKQWSYGVGLDIGMATRTRMQVYIPDAADQRTLLMSPKIETHIALAPYVGLTFRPNSAWSLTATLHAPTSWDTGGENHVRFWDYKYPTGQTAVVQSYDLTQGTEPWRVGAGIGKTGILGALAWEVGLQGVYTQWSKYRDRHGERPLDAWHDTVTLGLGWSLESAQRRLVGEFGVAPSPVPEQTGRTNYVDNTRWATSLGVEWPFHLFTTRYALGTYVQGQFMLPRSVKKDENSAHPVRDEMPDDAVDRVTGLPLAAARGLQTNNPGYPGYTSYGAMLGASMVLRVLR